MKTVIDSGGVWMLRCESVANRDHHKTGLWLNPLGLRFGTDSLLTTYCISSSYICFSELGSPRTQPPVSASAFRCSQRAITRKPYRRGTLAPLASRRWAELHL